MTTDRSTDHRVSPAAWPLILPIRFYQKFITPYTPATCRYYPTCSQYAVTSLRTHGAIKGLILTAWRLLRCNPWSDGGYDPTPERGRWRRPVGRAGTDRADAGDGVTDDAGDAVIRGHRHPWTSGARRTRAVDTAPQVRDAPHLGRTAA